MQKKGCIMLACILLLGSMLSTAMAGWEQSGGEWKYQLSDGSYVTGAWKEIDGELYYFSRKGIQVHDRWIEDCYLQSDGTMATNTYVDGTYVGIDGYPVTPVSGTWKKNAKGWWFQRTDGTYPIEAWELIRYRNKDNWYYFDCDGYMVHDMWFGGYYLTSDGSMAVHQWIGAYFLGDDGKIFLVSGGKWEKDARGWKYYRPGGERVANCGQWIDGDKDNVAEYYLFDEEGYMLADLDMGKYSINKDGAVQIDGNVITHTLSYVSR